MIILLHTKYTQFLNFDQHLPFISRSKFSKIHNLKTNQQLIHWAWDNNLPISNSHPKSADWHLNSRYKILKHNRTLKRPSNLTIKTVRNQFYFWKIKDHLSFVNCIMNNMLDTFLIHIRVFATFVYAKKTISKKCSLQHLFVKT
jgi:hypothetical protein